MAASKVSAQEMKWDIETCIDYAIANNIQVKQGTNSVEISRLERQQAKFNYLPTLSAGAGYNNSFGRSLDPTTYEFKDRNINNVNASASLNTQLFAGMQKLHTLRRTEFDLLASMQNVERIKNEITLAVAAAYLQVLYNKEQITTSESQLEALQSQIENTKKLVEAGSLALGGVFELEAQYAQEQYNLVSYRNDLSNSMLTLTQLLELRNVSQFDVVIPDLDHFAAGEPASDVDAVYDIALELPQVELERLRLLSAEKDVLIAKARLYPTLNFNANYGSSYSDARTRPMLGPDGDTYTATYPFFDQMGDNASTSLSFNLQVPIFNGLTARRNVRMARVSLQNQDLALTLAKDRLYKEIQQAYTDATGALNRYRSAESSVRSNRESFRYAEKKLSAGQSAPVDYTVAKNNLIVAQSSMIQAKYDYIFRIKILDFYRGIKITL